MSVFLAIKCIPLNTDATAVQYTTYLMLVYGKLIVKLHMHVYDYLTCTDM